MKGKKNISSRRRPRSRIIDSIDDCDEDADESIQKVYTRSWMRGQNAASSVGNEVNDGPILI